jgi:esterase
VSCSTHDSGNDEFDTLVEVRQELGLSRDRLPKVTRSFLDVGLGQRMSLVTWGTAEPELVFLHGGGQNARTWDLVAMHLDRPALAVDLPGHGHSSWRSDRDYAVSRHAESIAEVVGRLAPRALGVIGMSLGGLTTIRLARRHPDLVRRAVLVDVTPGTPDAIPGMTREQRGASVLTGRPGTFASLEEMVELAVSASPARLPAAVRRGVGHNAKQLDDGRWTWRYDQSATVAATAATAVSELWDDWAALQLPTMLVKGGDSAFVAPLDLAEVIRRQPRVRIESVAGAGHAVQSDRPQALSALIQDFVLAGT